MNSKGFFREGSDISIRRIMAVINIAMIISTGITVLICSVFDIKVEKDVISMFDKWMEFMIWYTGFTHGFYFMKTKLRVPESFKKNAQKVKIALYDNDKT